MNAHFLICNNGPNGMQIVQATDSLHKFVGYSSHSIFQQLASAAANENGLCDVDSHSPGSDAEISELFVDSRSLKAPVHKPLPTPAG